MRFLVTTVLVLATVGVANAEPVRSGFMIGGSLGAGGSSACDGCDRLAGATAELHIGGWLNPTWALSYEAWIFEGDPTEFVLRAQGAGLATVTRRVAPRAWVKAGAGMAMYTYDDALADAITGESMTTRYRGLGLGGAAGYELFQSNGSMVVDASVRLLTSLFPDHGAAMSGSVAIGLSWN